MLLWQEFNASIAVDGMIDVTVLVETESHFCFHNFFSFEEKRLKHAQIQYRNAVILIAYDNLKFASFHCTMARPEGDAAASPVNPPLVSLLSYNVNVIIN
mgnify:CR=1 FL=1